MDSGSDSRDEHLNESWIEFSRLNSQSEGSSINEPTGASSLLRQNSSPAKADSLANSSVERLLLEAQKESSCASSVYNNSRESSQESPKSVNSPACELNTNHEASETTASNWVLNWSSRPEIVPPSDMSTVTHDTNHSPPKRHRLSIRNTRVMRGILFVVEHLPVLLVTHACSFLLGAVTVVVYLRKSRRWSLTPLAAVGC